LFSGLVFGGVFLCGHDGFSLFLDAIALTRVEMRGTEQQ
jgi:hypothetical protein